MAFLRINEHMTVNTQYIVKVKWKVSGDEDELSASVFMTGNDKNEVVAIKGEDAYKLWDILHANEEYPHSALHDKRDVLPPSVRRQLRKEW